MLAPARLGLRALDDLHALAETAQISARERRLLLERLEEVRTEVAELNRNAAAVTGQAAELMIVGRSLQEVTGHLRVEARELSDDMEPVADVADRVQEAGEAMEEVAEGVRPLRSAAYRVGRMAERLTPGRRDG